MSGAEKTLAEADAVLEGVDRDAMSVDLQSIAATYERQKASGSPRAQVAHGRALVRRAAREGLGVEVEDDRSMDDLRAELKTRNEDRDEADRIKPAGRSKADLLAALAADDARG